MDTYKITIDGKEIAAKPGETILKAADAAGVYIPRLCFYKDMLPGGHCRICSVKINGKMNSSCTMPVADGMIIESNTQELNDLRKNIIEMLFIEGNHFCPFCEESGRCELQAMAYRLGMITPSFDYLYPDKQLDASHKDVFIDQNRCMLCGRCVRASREVDKKVVFGFEGRGINQKIAVDSAEGLGDTILSKADKAANVCPTGCIVIKRVGYDEPYGKRKYDNAPIGSEIESLKK